MDSLVKISSGCGTQLRLRVKQLHISFNSIDHLEVSSCLSVISENRERTFAHMGEAFSIIIKFIDIEEAKFSSHSFVELVDSISEVGIADNLLDILILFIGGHPIILSIAV